MVTDILSRTVSELSQLVQISLQRGRFDSKFQIEKVASHQSFFAGIVRPMNALQRCPWQFSHRCYGWGATSENRRFCTNAVTWIHNFRYKGSPPPKLLHG